MFFWNISLFQIFKDCSVQVNYNINFCEVGAGIRAAEEADLGAGRFRFRMVCTHLRWFE
jgi:hypothetical protein